MSLFIRLVVRHDYTFKPPDPRRHRTPKPQYSNLVSVISLPPVGSFITVNPQMVLKVRYLTWELDSTGASLVNATAECEVIADLSYAESFEVLRSAGFTKD